MDVFWANDASELADEAARELVGLLANKPDATIALPTGNTPLGLYQRLRALHKTGRLHCEQARFVNLDDFVGKSSDDPQSYAAFLWRHVFQPLNIKAGHVRLLRGDAPEIDAECRSFDQAIADAGGLELAILGIGANGHVAFNEPGSARNSTTRKVSLTEATRHAQQGLYKRASDVPLCGVTMGLRTIRDASRILLLVSGETKADALQRLLAGRKDENWPVTSLVDHPRLRVIADKTLASLSSATEFRSSLDAKDSAGISGRPVFPLPGRS